MKLRLFLNNDVIIFVISFVCISVYVYIFLKREHIVKCLQFSSIVYDTLTIFILLMQRNIVCVEFIVFQETNYNTIRLKAPSIFIFVVIAFD